MKKQTRFISLVMAILILVSCCLCTAFAGNSEVYANVSRQANKGNASSYAAPEGISSATVGETVYLNVAGTTDYKFSKILFAVKEPGSSYYYLVHSETANSYLRWANCTYTFQNTGTYSFYYQIDLLGGGSGTAFIDITVTSASSSSNSTSGTYNYNKSVYNVVPNLKADYCYNQNNYSRFLNSSGKNRGCTATAMCTCYAITHNTALSPNDVKWKNGQTSWEYATSYIEGQRTYSKNTYTQSEALKCIYNCITAGKPMIVGVNKLDKYGNLTMANHVVCAVGIRSGADYNNLKFSDILIVDPWGGTICTLASYSRIDTGWSLRVAI